MGIYLGASENDKFVGYVINLKAVLLKLSQMKGNRCSYKVHIQMRYRLILKVSVCVTEWVFSSYVRPEVNTGNIEW